MCGIAGIIGRLSTSNREALQRMHDAVVHRGPDAGGFWEAPPDSNGRSVMLAHRRLSILDLSPSGAQPMVDSQNGNAIVYNGEMYNYVELRDELLSAGQVVHSTGDTAVILRMLGDRGNEAISRFRGMFAFAFWDAKARELMLARDPLGIKPLYLARNPDADGEWSVIFASELRAILASNLLRERRLDPRAVASVIWNGFVAGPGTAVRGIESVWPSQVCVFDAHGKEKTTKYYWNVPQRQSSQMLDEQELAQVLEKSVRSHLVSDVPVAVFLSAGVDSSAVANLAQKASSDPIHTFTLAFEEAEYNEGQYARRIAEAIGTQHREIVLTEQHFVDQLDAALDSLDQPTFDGINSYYMSHALREAGFKVALVGTGGDELFGGYKSFVDLPILLKWIKRASWISPAIKRRAATLVSSLLQPSTGTFGPQTRWAKFPAMIDRGDNLLGLYQLAYALFLPNIQGELLANGEGGILTDGLCDEMRSRLCFETQSLSGSPLATISVLEQRLFLGERLLRDTDAASMASSVELRLPLVDHVLLENVGRVDDDVRFRPVGKKRLLRQIGLRGLDATLFERPKTGFVLPFDRWIRSGLGKAMDSTMRDTNATQAAGLNAHATARLWQAFLDKVPGIYWSRVWAIFVLVRWCQRHKVYI